MAGLSLCCSTTDFDETGEGSHSPFRPGRVHSSKEELQRAGDMGHCLVWITWCRTREWIGGLGFCS